MKKSLDRRNPTRSPDVAKGYGVDPDLLSAAQARRFLAADVQLPEPRRKLPRALADVIIPKDDLGPAASEVGAGAGMVDEWITPPLSDAAN